MDHTTIVAYVAILIALASAYYTRTLARNDTKRLKRKPLSVEVWSEPDPGRNKGFVRISVNVRNLTNFRAHIEAIVIPKKFDGVWLEGDLYKEDSFGGLTVEKAGTPTSKHHEITINRMLQPQGHEVSATHVSEARFYLYRPAGSNTDGITARSVKWAWVDGEKR